MSSPPRPEAALLPRPVHRYDPFYAIYLLEQRMAGGQPLGDAGRDARSERVRLRPSLSLAQPAVKVAQLGVTAETGERPGRAVMVQRFFGLGGAASPLPLWYSETLLQQELADRHPEGEGLTAASVACGLLDILNHRALSLRYRAWLRSHLSLIDAEREPIVLRAFSDALRLPASTDSSALFMLRLAGRMLTRNRPAMGLGMILQELASAGRLLPYEPRCNVEVRQLACAVRIPVGTASIGNSAPGDGFAAPRLGRGMRLGQDLLVNDSLVDRQWQLAVRLGPMSYASMQRLLCSESTERQRLVRCASSYVPSPFMLHIEVLVPRHQVPRATLKKRGEDGPLLLARQIPPRLCRNSETLVLTPDSLPQIAAGMKAAIPNIALRALGYGDAAHGLLLARLHKPALVIVRADTLELASAIEADSALAETALLFADLPGPASDDELYPRIRAALSRTCDLFRARVQLEPEACPAFH